MSGLFQQNGPLYKPTVAYAASLTPKPTAAPAEPPAVPRIGVADTVQPYSDDQFRKRAMQKAGASNTILSAPASSTAAYGSSKLGAS